MPLWRSKMELANHRPPLNQPPMILPKINNIVGGHMRIIPPIHEEMNAAYARYSAAYWANLRERYSKT